MAVQSKEKRRRRLGHIDRGEETQRELIDFKMVTFSLGGKDYGVDIMKVKEIAKYQNFTYVPNAPHFVQGVYNLRGEIISIIDMRRMFNLPIDDDNSDTSNGLILRLESNLLGIVVDKIDKVVGISSESIQPPHPIFGDINIKFISGVVEHEKRLYIILDVERIFGKEEETSAEVNAEPPVRYQETQAGKSDSTTPADATSDRQSASQPEATDKGFVSENLKTFAGFYVTPLNASWVDQRFRSWKAQRSEQGRPVQLEQNQDADEFLRDFYSPYTGQLWAQGYTDQVAEHLPKGVSNSITVWNPGCGKGLETFSLVCLLKKMYPDSSIKVWAMDKDLMAISSAPTLSFQYDDVPGYCRDFLVEGTKGYSFNQQVQDAILFEYSDVTNGSTVPDCDIILSRDLLSFLPEEQQKTLLTHFHEKLKPGGVLFLGKNEYPSGEGWSYFGKDAVSASQKKQ